MPCRCVACLTAEARSGSHVPVAQGPTVIAIASSISAQNWFVQGTGAISQASDYPRSDPRYVPAASITFGPITTVHSFNYTAWCYNDADIRELTARSEPAAEGDDAALPAWLPWPLTIGALPPSTCLTPLQPVRLS